VRGVDLGAFPFEQFVLVPQQVVCGPPVGEVERGTWVAVTGVRVMRAVREQRELEGSRE
jgi:hypothetical protein